MGYEFPRVDTLQALAEEEHPLLILGHEVLQARTCEVKTVSLSGASIQLRPRIPSPSLSLISISNPYSGDPVSMWIFPLHNRGKLQNLEQLWLLDHRNDLNRIGVRRLFASYPDLESSTVHFSSPEDLLAGCRAVDFILNGVIPCASEGTGALLRPAIDTGEISALPRALGFPNDDLPSALVPHFENLTPAGYLLSRGTIAPIFHALPPPPPQVSEPINVSHIRAFLHHASKFPSSPYLLLTSAADIAMECWVGESLPLEEYTTTRTQQLSERFDAYIQNLESRLAGYLSSPTIRKALVESQWYTIPESPLGEIGCAIAKGAYFATARIREPYHVTAPDGSVYLFPQVVFGVPITPTPTGYLLGHPETLTPYEHPAIGWGGAKICLGGKSNLGIADFERNYGKLDNPAAVHHALCEARVSLTDRQALPHGSYNRDPLRISMDFSHPMFQKFLLAEKSLDAFALEP